MKVKFVDFEEGVMAFASKLIGTMPTTAHKFISGIVLARFSRRIETALGAFSGEDGCVDISEIRKAVESGFRVSGDKVSFSLGDESTRLFFKPLTISVTRQDLETALADIETRFGE